MKVQIQVTVTREIEINREYYPEGHTNEQILADEINYAEELFHEWMNADNCKWATKGEIVEE